MSRKLARGLSGAGGVESEVATEYFEVCFLPGGLRGEIARGTPLRDAARELGLEIESLCGGRAACGKCRVRILDATEASGHGLHSHAVRDR